ncbi:MAG TPA: PAS domain-containing protein, partial [Acetobacteraceae bacterium]
MESDARPPRASVRERFLEALLESATDYAIFAMDLDGLVINWNEGAHRLLGWTEEEMIGHPGSVIFLPEDRKRGTPQAERQVALDKGRSADERWHQRKDGTHFWAFGELMPLRDEAGSVLGFVKILRDRTEQRLAAEAQRADAEFMRGVLASSGDCLKVLDLDAKLVFMSEGGQRIMEVSDFNAIQGCPWPEFWDGDGKADVMAAVAAAKSGGTGHFQGFARTMTGKPKWWDVQVTPILGADGRPEKLLAVSRDITEQRQIQHRLELS